MKIQCLVIMMCIRMFGASGTSEPVWFQGVSNYIQHNNDSYQQVIVLTSGHPEEPSRDPWIRRLLHITMEIYPTIRLNVNGSSGFEEKFTFHQNDPTSTLFIYLDDIQPSSSSAFEDIWNIINIIKISSTAKTIFKCLIILPSSRIPQDFDMVVRYGWFQKFKNLVFLEVVYCQEDITTIPKKCIDDGKLAVIRYINPFLDAIINRIYEPGMDLFPDVMSNMHGYRLKIGIEHQPPFSYVSWDENDKYESMHGPDISVIQTLAEKMNFTLEILPRLSTFEHIEYPSESGLRFLLFSETMDILASANPHYGEQVWDNSCRTGTLLSSRFCALVPIERAVRIALPKTVIAALILTIGIVSIFWASTWLFRFPQSWSVFHTVRVLFGIPVNPNHLRFKIPQQLVIKILMIVSLFFSANIYGSLMEISVDTDSEVEIENFDDLDHSGLTPMISPAMWNNIFANLNDSDQALINLKNKAQKTSQIQSCPSLAARDKNVSCLMNKIEGESFMKSTYQNGEATLKFTKTCFWSDDYVFLMLPWSPYRDRVEVLLDRLSEVGLKMMWYGSSMNVENEKGDKEDDPLEEIKNQSKGVLHKQLMVVILFGSTIAIIVFFGELLWYHYIKRWTRRRN